LHPTVTQAINPVRPTPPAPPDQTLLLSLYVIGNSMTDEIKTDTQSGLPDLVTQNSNRIPLFARHVIPGGVLDDGSLFDVGAGGLTTADYGNSRNALKNYPWKFVSFQPFDRPLSTDSVKIGLYIDECLSLAANAAYPTEFLIYQKTPRRLSTGTWDAASYKLRWDRTPYNPANANQPEECRVYYEQLTATVRTNKPSKLINMVPVGEVFYALNEMAIAGTLPGITAAWDFYDKVDGQGAFDPNHLTNYGSYIVALTYYSCLTKKTPIGVAPTESYKINGVALSSTLQTKIQEAVRDTILAKSVFTGITTFSTDTIAPTATIINNPNVTTASATAKDLSIKFTDNIKLDLATITAGAITVKNALSVAVPFTLDSITNTSDVEKTANFKVLPNGGWNETINGTYTIGLTATVKDLAGNAIVAVPTFGAFVVQIGSVAVNIPSSRPYINQYPLEIINGTFFSATITLTDNGIPVDLTGLVIKSQIKNTLGTLQGEFTVIQANQVTNPGVIQLSAAPSIVALAPGFYNRGMRGLLWYDILITSSQGAKVAFYPSEVHVIQGVTYV
jgi:hypothetical protein